MELPQDPRNGDLAHRLQDMTKEIGRLRLQVQGMHQRGLVGGLLHALDRMLLRWATGAAKQHEESRGISAAS